MSADTAGRIEARLGTLGVAAPEGFVPRAAVYYDLLFRWNRTVNLTALRDDDEGIDRLIVEPLVAAEGLAGKDVLVDVGSGGGSPAVPMKLAAPGVTLTMIEVRSRKGAFLREVVRALDVGGAQVEVCRIEEWVRPGRVPAGGVVSMRAVRLDAPLAAALRQSTCAGAELWFFGTGAGAGDVPGWRRRESRVLVPSLGSSLSVYSREDAVALA